MKTRLDGFRSSAPFLAALIAIGGCVALYRVAAAAEGQTAAAEQRVVSINLSRMFAELKESDVVREKLVAMDEEISAFKAERDAEVQQLVDELEVAAQGGPQERRISEQILLKSNERDAWIDAKMRMRALEESLEYVRMYNKIVEAAAGLAEDHGFDYIMLDDSDIRMKTDLIPREAIAQLFTRRIIYRSDSADVTDDLIDRMNNAFAAGE